MHILGSMLVLDENEARVPVPWWHRASLGLQTGTQVYVSVTHAQAGRPGDLLISVLDPNRWDKHISINCLRPDEPGVIEKAFELVHDWNIALAETVTIEGGRLHYVDLICEPSPQMPRGEADDKAAHLRQALDDSLFLQAHVAPFRPLNTTIAWSRLGTVDNGWVKVHGTGTWRHVVRDQLRALGVEEDFDTSKVVLSGDTTSRLFRAVIPRKGALMVNIEHADKPGVLRQLAHVLQEARVNVLSCLLKRGGAAARNAILVAVCEPVPGPYDVPLDERIRRALNGLEQEMRPDATIRRGLAPEKVIYSHHPDDVVAHVPSHLRARVIERRAILPPEKLPVFLSRRFLSDTRPRGYAHKVRSVLEESECVVVEANILPGGVRGSLDEVSSAMWAAQAGIVLGVEPTEGAEVAFSLNLAHEFGFMQGQGKPLLLLVETPSRVEKELDGWSNIKGITAPRFQRDVALSDTEPQSLRAAVVRWLRDIRRGDHD